MANTFTPNKWGPARTSKDYEIFMEGASCVASPVSLLEHGISDFSRELSDPVKAPVTSKVRGKIRTVNKTIRAAEITETTFKLAFPNALWTPALNMARQGGAAPTDMFALYLCPAQKEYEHAYVFPGVLLDPVEFVNAFVTNDTSTELLDQTSTAHITEEKIVYAVGLSLIKTEAAAVYDVAFNYDDCVDVSQSVFQSLIAVGATKGIYTSDDRFANQTAVSVAAIPVGSVISSVISDGSIRIVGYRDVAAITTAATGGVAISFDEGVSFSLATGISVPVNALAKYNNLYIAVGGTGAGAARLFYSLDGLSWTSLTSTALPASDALTSIAVDVENNVFYVVGEAGKLLSGTSTGSSILLSSLTANLPGAPSGTLNAVAVLAPDFVAVGGASGYYAETHDGGVTWTQPFSGGASAITAIAGNCFRTLIGVATKVYERSVLNKQTFTVMTPQNGYTMTGNVTSIEKALGDDNYFVVGTDANEIMFVAPFYPNA